ncbi:MAG TPA: hypothetical protein VGM23_14055, partial [Armatimonadota bacterium]
MLISSPSIKFDPELNRRLEAAGIFAKVQPFSMPLNREMLQLFDLVILPDFVGDGRPNFASGIAENINRQQNIQKLSRYVQEGGGVFVVPFIADLGQVCAEGCDLLLVPWGARVLAEQIRDDAHKGAKDAYSWTTAIT